MNETLSPSQAKKIVTDANGIILMCKLKMEAKSAEFVEKLSKIWEDNNAVEFAQSHKRTMEKMIDQLGENNEKFAETVEVIANSYTKAGNMASVSVDKIKVKGSIGVECIKEHFEDGNGDDFGFKDPNTGVTLVMDAFETLKRDLESIASETITRINSIPAFGNTQIRINLARSAGKIVEILDEEIAEAKKMMDEFLEKTANAYITTGQNAVDSAKLGNNITESMSVGVVTATPVK